MRLRCSQNIFGKSNAEQKVNCSEAVDCGSRSRHEWQNEAGCDRLRRPRLGLVKALLGADKNMSTGPYSNISNI